jgi:hypothetical protein
VFVVLFCLLSSLYEDPCRPELRCMLKSWRCVTNCWCYNVRIGIDASGCGLGRYLLRDRDQSYGEPYSQTAALLGIEEVLTAPRLPWQNPYAERLISSIRRECLDHVMVLHERGLRCILKSYF